MVQGPYSPKLTISKSLRVLTASNSPQELHLGAPEQEG
eukprot:Gb_02061 [translate_table: standard]